MSKTTPVIFVDGSSYLFRAFFAMPNLSNENNEPTGVIYGVLNMLKSLINEYRPEYMAVVFDAKGKTFRHQMYPDYKANRPPMPDELRRQIEPLHQLIGYLGIPLISIEGVEADDVLGTLAKIESEQGNAVLISTGDKDLAQLVSDKVHLINTMNREYADPEFVKQKFGIAPEQIRDYLALVGDTADNIPGIPKCGPKTAVKWLQQYGNIDNLIAHADEIKGKIGENLRANIEQLRLAYQLVTIDTHVPLDPQQKQYKLGQPDVEKLAEAYKKWGFKRWLETLERPQGFDAQECSSEKPKYELILSKKQLDQWLEQIRKQGFVCIDTETTSIDYMQADLVGLSFCIQPHKAAYLPLGHDYSDAPKQLDKDETLARLKPLLEDQQIAKIGQNLKYDTHVLQRAGIKLQGIAHDTMLQSYIYNSVASRHNMDALAAKYLGVKTTKFEDIAGKGKKQQTFNRIKLDTARDYAAEDADITLQLHQYFWPKISKEPKLKTLYEQVEMPILQVLQRMEQNGVLIDCGVLKAQEQELSQQLQQLQQQAHELAGQAFNLSSPKQLQEIFFERLKLPVIKKTPKGAPSTAEEVLETLALDYPLPKVILQHRTLSKLLNTYVSKLPNAINPQSGRIHTSYQQAVTATGRLSSTDPNLQNIPIKTEQGRKIRLAFIAPPGSLIVAADYSQIELRIMAHLSQDQNLLAAFHQQLDVHSATAAEVFGVPLDQVTRQQRRSAKAINFGLIYGMSAFGLAKQLGIGRQEAQDYIERYFQRYPGVKDYMEQMRALAKQQGYVETVCGRRLYLPEINARNAMRRQYAERTAINAPMQGTAADIIKKAMVNIHRHIQEHSDEIKMIMQVHDELVFEVRKDHLQHWQALIRQEMENALTLSVPLLVELGTGENWQEAH